MIAWRAWLMPAVAAVAAAALWLNAEHRSPARTEDIVRRPRVAQRPGVPDVNRDRNLPGRRAPAARSRGPAEWGSDELRELDRTLQLPGHGDDKVARIAGLVAAWAGSDPSAAWAWVAAHYPATPGKRGVAPVLALLQALAVRDPRLVVAYADFVRHSAPAAEGVDACSAAITAMVTTGHVPLARGAAELWLAGPGLRTVNAATISLLALALADDGSPRVAAGWLHRISRAADCSEAVGMLASSWAEANPVDALGWAQSLRDSGQRTIATQRAFAVWADHDPEGAAQWFLAHEAAEGSDQLIPIFLQHSQLPYTSPAAALRWAELAEGAATRARAMALALDPGEPPGP